MHAPTKNLLVLVIVFVAFFGIQWSQERKTLDSIKNFKMFGLWAQDCTRLSGIGNWYVEYTVNANGVITRKMTRSDEVRVSIIKKASIESDDVLSIEEIYGVGWGEFVGFGKKYRIKFSDKYTSYKSITSTVDGRKMIENGVMIDSAHSSPVITKCRDAKKIIS